MKTIRCKAKHGVTYSWRVGETKDGRFKPLSVGKPSNRMPMDFAPFEIMDAVLNRSISFASKAEAEAYVRSL